MNVVVMAAAAPTTNVVTQPPPHARPADRDDQNGERERNGDARDVENVAKGVVLRPRLERSRFLNQRDEHDSSSLSVARTCRAAGQTSNGTPECTTDAT